MAEYTVKQLKEQQRDKGRGFFIHGKTDTGKSASIATLADAVAPKETIVYPTEPKSIIEPLQESYPELVNNLPILFRGVDGEFKTTEDMLVDMNSLLQEIEKGRSVGAIVIDSMSFESTTLKLELENSRFEKEDAKVGGNWKYNPFLEKTMVDRPEWGALASWLTRLTSMLVNFTHRGIIVLATSVSEAWPKWDSSLEAGPSFQGKQYPQSIHGFFSHIGYVERTPDNNFPSTIQFVNVPELKSNVFCRCASRALREKCLQNGGKAPLDFRKILKVIG